MINIYKEVFLGLGNKEDGCLLVGFNGKLIQGK